MLRTLGIDMDDYMSYIEGARKRAEFNNDRSYTTEQAVDSFNRQAARAYADLDEQGLGTLGLDKYYDTNVEVGGDQADLQANDANYRDSEDGSSKLRRRTQQAISDEAEGRRARKTGESAEGRNQRQMNEAADESLRYRMAKGGVAFPQRQSQSALQQLQAYRSAPGRTPEEIAKADAAIQRLRASTDPGYAKAIEFDEGVRAVRNAVEANSPERQQQLAERLVSLSYDEPTSGIGAPDAQYPSGRPYRRVSTVRPGSKAESERQNNRSKVAEAIVASLPSGGVDPVKQEQNRRAAGPAVTAQEREMLAGPELGRIGEVIAAEVPGGYKDYIREVPTIFGIENDPQNFAPAVAVETQQGMQYYDQRPMLARKGNVNVTLGNPLAVQGVQMPASNSNAAGTAQNLNAPQGGTSLLDVMERNQFSARQSGTYPQVGISQELQVLTERLNRLGIDTSGGIRNLNDAQRLFDEAVSQGMEAGAKFTAPGSKKVVDNPGAEEVFAKMRYTEPEMRRAANALIQLELGGRQNVNLDLKGAFQAGNAVYPYELAQNRPNPAGPLLVGPQQLSIAQRNAGINANPAPVFGASEAMGDFNAGAELESANARVKPKFAALTGEKIEGTPQERREALADAQRPYIGQVAGEEPVGIEGKRDNPNYRYNRTGETTSSGIRSVLTQQAMDRAEKSGKKVDLVAIERNARNAEAVQRRADEFEAAGAPKRSESPISSEIQKRRDVVQQVTRPKPAFSGNPSGANRTVDERIGLSTLEDSNPVRPAPRDESMQPITDEIRNQLAELNSGPMQGPSERPRVQTSGPAQGPVPGSARKQFIDRANYVRTSPRYQTGRRVGYGAAALAGLGALIGGERDRREEEAMR